MTVSIFDDHMAFRISSEDKALFKEQARKVGKPYQVLLRELIVAFNKDTLRINQRRYKDIYDD